MRRASYCGAIGSGCFASTLPTQADQQTAAYGASLPLDAGAMNDEVCPKPDLAWRFGRPKGPAPEAPYACHCAVNDIHGMHLTRCVERDDLTKRPVPEVDRSEPRRRTQTLLTRIRRRQRSALMPAKRRVAAPRRSHPAVWTAILRTRRAFTVAQDARTGHPAPHNHRESGECRLISRPVSACWMWQQATGSPRFHPRRFADRAARSYAQTEKVYRQAPAVLLEDIFSRLLQEKRT
jgi:hypothetical protein